MSRVLKGLEPKKVFQYFEEICGIPHGSGNTKKISDYCVSFAKEHGLKYRQDEKGNVVIWKGAAPGYEQAETVILQGHMDMVAVKDEDCDLDLENEGLRLAITEDGEWIYAKGTSLGGDDGIALAYAMAVLDDDTLEHPALEAVFTVDEEIGLVGATALDASDLKGTLLMNMDSEEDGIFLTSCAGGATMECSLPVQREERNGLVYEWCVKGLRGGHSGTEIHLGGASANLIFGRYLAQVGASVDFAVCHAAGGEKDNAIPNKCTAVLVVDAKEAAKFEEMTEQFSDTLRTEYAKVEPDMSFSLIGKGLQSVSALNRETQQKFTALMELMPSGIQRMMPDIPDMVQTSLNMGIMSCSDDTIKLTYSVRSALGSEKEWLLNKMEDLTALLGGKSVRSGVYSAWEYQPDSRLQTIMKETFEELTGKEPVLTGIHAGVECGIFCEKIPGIDCISYGPAMRDIHTAREKLNIPSVIRNYELTIEVLKRLK